MKKMNRILALFLAALLLLALCACGNKQNDTDVADSSKTEDEALDYPKETITMVVGFQAGAGSDLLARCVASYMDLDGQTMVINNITGSGGIIGMMECYNAPGDGYTLCTFLPESITVNMLNGVVQDDIFDNIIPIACPVYDAFTICVRGDSEYNSLDDLVEASKKSTKAFHLAGSTGGVTQVSAIQFLEESDGANIKYVPYDDGNTARTALLGGNAECLIASLSEVKTYSESGDFRVLAVLADERASFMPDTPTAIEQGYNVTAGQHRGFAVSPGTPDEIVRYLEDKMYEAYNKPEFKDYLQDTLGYNMSWMGHDDYVEFVKGLKATFEPIMSSQSDYVAQ